MSPNEENPSYVMVSTLYGVHHLNLMEWDKTVDGYQVRTSMQLMKGLKLVEINEAARKWAGELGVEFR